MPVQCKVREAELPECAFPSRSSGTSVERQAIEDNTEWKSKRGKSATETLDLTENTTWGAIYDDGFQTVMRLYFRSKLR